MGPAEQVASPDVVLAACAGLVLCLLGGLLLAHAARRRRAALDAELARSRTDVESLSRKVEELSDEVVRARHAAELDREYVITSLAGEGGADVPPQVGAPHLPVTSPVRPPVGQVLENQLVDALARRPQGSAARARAVDLVVRTVSVAHGLRRALSPDVLDRAAAEAHVARRRSRRQRRREVRQARRLVRGVAAESSATPPTARPDQEVA
jgi:hypothetical protein